LQALLDHVETAIMSYARKSDYEMRNSILQLLSPDEVARVGTSGGTVRLGDGDEYIDMAAPDNGVRCVHKAMQVTMGQVLPRSAVSAETWAKIGARFGRRFVMTLAK
jgi:hypothetical protein